MLSVGDDLISIAVAEPRAAQSLARRLLESGQWFEVVAGIDSVVVRFDVASMNHGSAEQRLQHTLDAPFREPEFARPVVEIPVSYGGEYGPDLAAICEQLNLSAAELVVLHTAEEYEVDMLGFIPGFAYIGGLPEQLDVARLPQPRVHVAAGSVGIAGGRTGLYALPGPGGWPLIGRTQFTLFEPSDENPFVLQPGMRVRFVAMNLQ